MSLLFKTLFYILLSTISIRAIAQEIDFKIITSKGSVPEEFYKSIRESYEKDLALTPVYDDSKKNKASKLYLQSANLSLFEILWSGKVIYGDVFTNYINKVGKKVLEQFPEIKEEVRFYTFKSSSINAFTTSKGAIFVNIGLLSKIENEAQLAFVLCHELVHYKQRHSYKSFLERYELFKKSKSNQHLSYTSKIDAVYKFSRKNEYEADSIGILIYNKLGYARIAVLDVLEELYYSYLPIENIPFDYTFSSLPNLNYPSNLKLDSVKNISDIIVYSKDYLTHPNIRARIKKAKKLLNNENNILYKFTSEKEFKAMRKTARYELVNLLLIEREYAKALYTIYTLEKEHGLSNYLTVSTVKAFYGISKYKSVEELNRVMKGYYNIEGESQKMYYFIKKTTKRQLNALAIKMSYTAWQKDKENALLKDYFYSLVKDFVVILEEDLSTFNKTKKIYKGKKQKNFYLNAFIPFMNDTAFHAAFDKYKPELKKKKEKELMAYKTLEKEKKKKRKQIIKNGYDEKINRLIILDPICIVNSKKGKHQFEESLYEKEHLDQIIKESCKKSAVEFDLLSTTNMSPQFDFKSFILLKEWDESWNNNVLNLEMTPLQSDQIKNIVKKYNTQYVLRIYLYQSHKYKSNEFLIELYNLETGKEILSKYYNGRGTLSESQLEKYLIKELKIISKSK